MTKVKVSLCAIFRNEHFTVLSWAHCAWINVDVRVKLHHSHFKTTS
ncbi:hypothetical protein VCHENC02_0431A, partial [Vibrio harveyi]